MTWLVCMLLAWLWPALVWGQALPFPGPGVKAYAAGAGPFTDTFDRANGALGANWTNNVQAHTIVSNVATGTASQDSLSSYTAQNLGTDHYAQVTLGTMTGGDNAGPCVRVSGTSGYCYYAMSGAVRSVYRVVSGAWQLVTSATTPQTNTVGDILKLAVSGTGATVTLTLTRNGAADTGLGSTVADTNASRIVTGNFAGISVFGNVWRLDNFQCNTGG
jgi:hypothetical protein